MVIAYSRVQDELFNTEVGRETTNISAATAA